MSKHAEDRAAWRRRLEVKRAELLIARSRSGLWCTRCGLCGHDEIAALLRGDIDR